MKELNKAKEILLDKEKREKHDQLLIRKRRDGTVPPVDLIVMGDFEGLGQRMKKEFESKVADFLLNTVAKDESVANSALADVRKFLASQVVHPVVQPSQIQRENLLGLCFESDRTHRFPERALLEKVLSEITNYLSKLTVSNVANGDRLCLLTNCKSAASEKFFGKDLWDILRKLELVCYAKHVDRQLCEVCGKDYFPSWSGKLQLRLGLSSKERLPVDKFLPFAVDLSTKCAIPCEFACAGCAAAFRESMANQLALIAPKIMELDPAISLDFFRYYLLNCQRPSEADYIKSSFAPTVVLKYLTQCTPSSPSFRNLCSRVLASHSGTVKKDIVKAVLSWCVKNFDTVLSRVAEPSHLMRLVKNFVHQNFAVDYCIGEIHALEASINVEEEKRELEIERKVDKLRDTTLANNSTRLIELLSLPEYREESILRSAVGQVRNKARGTSESLCRMILEFCWQPLSSCNTSKLAWKGSQPISELVNVNSDLWISLLRICDRVIRGKMFVEPFTWDQLTDGISLEPPRDLTWAKVVEHGDEIVVCGQIVRRDFDMCVAFEGALFKLHKDGKYSCSDVAFGYYNLLTAVSHPDQLLHCLLNAAKWFLLQIENDMGNKKRQGVLGDLVVSAMGQIFAIIFRYSITCAIQVFMSRNAVAILLRLVEVLPFSLDQRWRQSYAELLAKFAQLYCMKARFFPATIAPQVQVAEACILRLHSGEIQNHYNRYMLQQFFNGKCEIPAQDIFYHLLEDAFATMESDSFAESRIDAAYYFLKANNLPYEQIENFMASKTFKVDSEGFFHRTGQLCWPDASGQLGKFSGLRVDMRGGVSKIEILSEPPGKSGNLVCWEDIAAASLIQTPFLQFSLDPVDFLKYPYHPFNNVYVNDKIGEKLGESHKSILAGTPFLDTVWHTDFLLKQFVSGFECSQIAPFDLRPCRSVYEGVPEEMVFQLSRLARRNYKVSHSRFWIQVDSTEVSTSETKDYEEYICGNVKMSVRHSPQYVDPITGELIDAPGDFDNEEERKFCEYFTENYDSISEYYPEFARLKELAKMLQICFRLRHRCGWAFKVSREVSSQISKSRDDLKSQISKKAGNERWRIRSGNYSNEYEALNAVGDAERSALRSVEKQCTEALMELDAITSPFINWMNDCCELLNCEYNQISDLVVPRQTISVLWSPTVQSCVDCKLVYGGVLLQPGKIINCLKSQLQNVVKKVSSIPRLKTIGAAVRPIVSRASSSRIARASSSIISRASSSKIANLRPRTGGSAYLLAADVFCEIIQCCRSNPEPVCFASGSNIQAGGQSGEGGHRGGSGAGYQGSGEGGGGHRGGSGGKPPRKGTYLY